LTNDLYDDEEKTKVFEGHFPHGASVRSFAHFAQLINSKTFKKYDYQKKEKNLEVYG